MPSHTETLATPAAIRERIDLRRLPWIRPLVGAYLERYASVASLFAGDPADPASWRATIARAQRGAATRAGTARVLAAQLEQRGAPAAAREQAARLAATETVAIVTGQQAGAFGGPLYTLLKAITTIQLARRIQAEYGVVTVPVFWVESEDHDWDEIRHVEVLDRDQQVASLTLPPLDGAGARPVRTLVLDDRVDETLTAVGARLAPSEFTPDILSSLQRHYRAGTGVATAFAGWLDELLGSLGLVVFDAGDPAAKPLVSDLFAAELTQPGRSAALVRQAAQQMKALGHSPQIEPNEDAVCLFYLDHDIRHPIRHCDDGCTVGDTVRPVQELAAEASAHPERFSPNVLLRPLVQDRLFPTICYVAGPSELAYQAQLGDVYTALGVERPMLLPRASATLLDSAAVRFLDRFSLPFEDLQQQDESALNRLLEHQLPPIVNETLQQTIAAATGQMGRLRDVVTTVDPTLAGVVDTTVDRITDTLRTLESKIVQASKKKDETIRRQFHRTRTLTFPAGAPQERVLGTLFFVNRYGPGLPARLLDVLPLETSHHYVIAL
jgi:bacillithiol biosynthesis cysteine-adding enzyme BshC